jgi:hypothetical protein
VVGYLRRCRQDLLPDGPFVLGFDTYSGHRSVPFCRRDCPEIGD